MIITRTPLRISFAGGGSDIKEYYKEYGGCVISTSINKYIYLSLHPYFYENKTLLKYSQTELVSNTEEIKHKIIKEVFKLYNINGVDFSSNADIPSEGTGLGSSSAFTVGLIHLCNLYKNKYISKETIAKIACDIEIDTLKEPIGKQDQYACAVGGMNFIKFNGDDSTSIEKIYLNEADLLKLQNNLLMFYTGITRKSNSVLKEQRENILNKSNISHLHKMTKLVFDLKNHLSNGNVDVVGEILHAGWNYKKEMASSVSNDYLDNIYNIAIKNGAGGGKILGAGGGGFFLFFTKEQEKLRRALDYLKEFKFKFDTSGTIVIYS